MENTIGEYKGTTTVAAVCNDGVIMATDTRATMGSYVASKHAKKVYQITDQLAMTISIGMGAYSEWMETPEEVLATSPFRLNFSAS